MRAAGVVRPGPCDLHLPSWQAASHHLSAVPADDSLRKPPSGEQQNRVPVGKGGAWNRPCLPFGTEASISEEEAKDQDNEGEQHDRL